MFSEYGHLLNVLVLLTTTLLDKVFKVTLIVLVIVWVLFKSSFVILSTYILATRGGQFFLGQHHISGRGSRRPALDRRAGVVSGYRAGTRTRHHTQNQHHTCTRLCYCMYLILLRVESSHKFSFECEQFLKYL